MKKIFYPTLILLCMGATRVSAQLAFTNLNFNVQHADIAAVDIDGDGDLDVLVSGEDAGVQKLQLFKNNGSGTLTPAASPFTPVTRTTFDFGDINGDGKLDMIMSGFSAAGVYDSVYTSDGAGNFTRATGIALPQMAPSCGFADLNNDGYTDIYIFGNKDFGHSKIFFNNKTGGFTESDQFDAYNFVDPVVTVIDYDNDKDLDLFVTAGYEDAAATRFSRMFKNTNGTFTEQNLNLIPKGNGSAVWGDYDGDGYADLLLNGDGFLGSGEDNDGVYRLYRNNAGVFTAVTTFMNYRQNSTGDGGRFADWDNDGDLDVIVTGYNSTTSTQATDIFLNSGGTFTPYVNNSKTPGVSESSIEVADLNGDGDLDLLVTGFSNNDFDGAGTVGPFNTNIALLVANPAVTVNVKPTAPTNLSVSGSQASITFTWNAATDATTPQNALSYNMFLVNDQGKTFMFSLSDTTTGKLMVQKMGNVDLNKGWIIKGLPAGNYRWGVQAVDNSFAASLFTKANFTVNANGTLPISLLSYNVKAEGNKARIEWSTAIEQNNDHFEVQRSGDGITFNKLAIVRSQKADNSQYVVYDNNPSNGKNYYRLLQYDLDGKEKNQGIRIITFNTTKRPSVISYPNPTYSEIGIRLSNYAGNKVNVTMADFTGKIIHSETIVVNNSQGYYPLNIKTKPASGQYIINVSGDDLKASLNVMVK